ncbi:hypothetical protein UFOVP1290_500 [uncultured Caudovirales phage]|uniref:Macro domain-containing protein n=1 Tax=uncultured Caudovirales phage TaxID=2100421 RepID=A0A6J5RHM9_9CAUD|nr:hypothetical protein UFOVP1290_500 [uncultured Caudovirales phage]
MKEIRKDLFECILDSEVDAICITTNGHYTSDGSAIMGGGCAAEAARRWIKMPETLGKLLKTSGKNIPFIIGAVDANGDAIDIKSSNVKCLIFSFPTIDNLMFGSDIDLIKNSCDIMNKYAKQYNLKKIASVRFGSGIGGLDWYTEVKPVVENILDDRFIICCQENDELR